jgi:hypothetical protein
MPIQHMFSPHPNSNEVYYQLQGEVPSNSKNNPISVVSYTINRLPTPLLDGKSPFEILFGRSANYANIHPFGCRVYHCLHDYMAYKFSPHSVPCIFLGYNPFHKGFCCLNPFTYRIYITHHS